MKPRSTRQLTATYDALLASTDHPTAERVLDRVRRVLPHISSGTVYRNLEKLRDQGWIQIVRLDRGIAHYDAAVHGHDHFVCEACGAVVDVERSVPRPDVDALERSGFLARRHATAVYGVCPPCQSTRPSPRTRTTRERRHGRRRLASAHPQSA